MIPCHMYQDRDMYDKMSELPCNNNQGLKEYHDYITYTSINLGSHMGGVRNFYDSIR